MSCIRKAGEARKRDTESSATEGGWVGDSEVTYSQHHTRRNGKGSSFCVCVYSQATAHYPPCPCLFPRFFPLRCPSSGRTDPGASLDWKEQKEKRKMKRALRCTKRKKKKERERSQPLCGSLPKKTNKLLILLPIANRVERSLPSLPVARPWLHLFSVPGHILFASPLRPRSLDLLE